MHSLDTGHNKIIWQLRVKGKIPRWPDLGEDYRLVVLPLRKGEGAMSDLKIAVRKQPAQFRPGGVRSPARRNGRC